MLEKYDQTIQWMSEIVGNYPFFIMIFGVLSAIFFIIMAKAIFIFMDDRLFIEKKKINIKDVIKVVVSVLFYSTLTYTSFTIMSSGNAKYVDKRNQPYIEYIQTVIFDNTNNDVEVIYKEKAFLNDYIYIFDVKAQDNIYKVKLDNRKIFDRYPIEIEEIETEKIKD